MGSEYEYKIVKKIFAIEEKDGYSIQLNLVRWNGNDAKYDLRRWKDGSPLKGISMTEEALNQLSIKMNEFMLQSEEMSAFSKLKLLKHISEKVDIQNVMIADVISDTATYNYLRRNNIASLSKLLELLKNDQENSLNGFTKHKKQIIYSSLENYANANTVNVKTKKTDEPLFSEVRECYENLPIDSLNVFLSNKSMRSKVKSLKCQTIGDLTRIPFGTLKSVLDDELMIRFVEIEKQLKNKPAKLISHVWNKRMNSRNWKAVVKRSDGESLQSIGKTEGLSRERVRQIVLKFYEWQEPFLMLIKNEIEAASNKTEMLNKLFPREENRQLYQLWVKTYMNSDYTIDEKTMASFQQLSLFEDGFLKEN